MNNSDRLGPNADSIYASLIALHDGLSTEESAALDARLILLMVNEIGDQERLSRIFSQARSVSG